MPGASVNVLEAETGFFYAGTYLGKKKILAIGAGFDGQKDFHAYAADAFFDYPLGPGVAPPSSITTTSMAGTR